MDTLATLLGPDFVYPEVPATPDVPPVQVEQPNGEPTMNLDAVMAFLDNLVNI